MDDKQLMAQIAAGDQAALQTLLRRHGPLLQYILKPILTDPGSGRSAWRISPCACGSGPGTMRRSGGSSCRG